MDQRGRQLEDNVELILAETVVETAATVIFATPVDTGRARNSWLTGVNSAPSGFGAPKPGGTDASAMATSVATTLRVDDVGVIVNNLPYIKKLNNGSSKQAPAGFVQKAAQTAVRAIRSRRLLR